MSANSPPIQPEPLGHTGRPHLPATSAPPHGAESRCVGCFCSRWPRFFSPSSAPARSMSSPPAGGALVEAGAVLKPATPSFDGIELLRGVSILAVILVHINIRLAFGGNRIASLLPRRLYHKLIHATVTTAYRLLRHLRLPDYAHFAATLRVARADASCDLLSHPLCAHRTSSASAAPRSQRAASGPCAMVSASRPKSPRCRRLSSPR